MSDPLPPVRNWTVDRLPDLTGRTYLVTGANSGIGYHAAAHLRRAGGDLLVGARSPAKGKAAVRSLGEIAGSGRLELVELDLADSASIRAAAARVGELTNGLDAVINNAGIMQTPQQTTADGFEMQFGTNHVGHFLLTNMLVPSLLEGAPARVINLSSGGHRGSDIVWDDPNFEQRPYDKFSAYGQSKTANILFTVELDRLLRDRGVRSYAVHPGMIITELGRHMTRDDFAQLKERAKSGPSGGLPAYKSVEAGAATSVWAATAPDLADRGGVYLADCQVSQDAAPWALDPDSARRLWSLTEDLVGQRFSW